MEEHNTILRAFELIKPNLKKDLSSLSFPSDIQSLESILNNLFTERIDLNNYINNLPKLSIGVLQHCFQIIRIQNNLTNTFEFIPDNTPISQTFSQNESAISKNKHVLIGTFIGGLVGGGWILPSWGSILMSTIGCAVAILLKRESPNDVTRVITQSTKVNLKVETLINTIQELCCQLDSLMQFTNSYVNSSKEPLTQKPDVSLENFYPNLLGSITNLYMPFAEGAFPEDIYSRIKDIFDSLEDYDYKLVDFTPDRCHYFNIVESPYINEDKMVRPALLKGGVLVEKGKYLIATNKNE